MQSIRCPLSCISCVFASEGYKRPQAGDVTKRVCFGRSVILAVTWVANEGEENKVIELFRLLSEASRKEPGCVMFIVHRGIENPKQFFVYEQYRDHASLDAHRETPYLKRSLAAHYLRMQSAKKACSIRSLRKIVNLTRHVVFTVECGIRRASIDKLSHRTFTSGTGRGRRRGGEE